MIKHLFNNLILSLLACNAALGILHDNAVSECLHARIRILEDLNVGIVEIRFTWRV